jgi:YVTN family beta-propeller protein
LTYWQNCLLMEAVTEIMIRPPVFVGNAGTFETYMIDPISKVVSEKYYPTYLGHGLAVNPGSSRLYEATFEKFSSNGALRIYDGCGNHALLLSLETGGDDPLMPVISQDGSRIYVTNSGSNDISVIDTETATVADIISVDSTPWGAAMVPDGSKVYVANKDDNTVSVISTVSNIVINTLAVETEPWGVAVNPSGTKAYVANSSSGTVSVIDINSDVVIATIPVGSGPHWLACTHDGNYMYVTNSESATVSVINTGSDSVIQTIPVEANPEGIAVFPDGNEVYVATDSTVNVINTSDYSVSIVSLPDPHPPYSHKLIPLVISDPTSRFEGRITGAGVPIKNALIRVVQSEVEKGNTTTNTAGDYSVYNLRSGSYDIEVSAPDFYSQTISNQIANTGNTTIVNFDLISTGIALEKKIPTEFSLAQNFPNPFNPTTVISWQLAISSDVDLSVYNLLGQKVATLVSGKMPAGYHEFEFNGQNFSSGVYLYRIEAGAWSDVKKMVLLR